jgi:hypothetical protein
MRERRNAYRFLVGETCRRRWKDNIKMGRKGTGWVRFHAGQDKDKRRPLVSRAV